MPDRRGFRHLLVLALCLAGTTRPLVAQTPAPGDRDVRVIEVNYLDDAQIREIMNRFVPGLAYTFDLNSSQLVYFDTDAASGVPTILEALDVPQRPVPGIEVTAFILLGTRSGTTSPDFREDLARVVTQLEETLPYDGFTLLDTMLIRAVPGEPFSFSGILPRLPRTADELPYIISGRPRLDLTEDGPWSLGITNFNFFVDIFFGDEGRNRRVGIDTAVAMREGDPVVVGRASFSDFSLVLVMDVVLDEGAP
jgi:hypothetical protein